MSRKEPPIRLIEDRSWSIINTLKEHQNLDHSAISRLTADSLNLTKAERSRCYKNSTRKIWNALISQACSQLGRVGAITYLKHESLWTINQLGSLLKDKEQTKNLINSWRKISQSSNRNEEYPSDDINSIIAYGETAKVEFKSTMRKNLRSGRNESYIEDAVLRSLCAFLNTNGGRLIIGISDSGDPVGIDKDNFKSRDKYLQHLVNLIKDRMGTTVATLIDFSFERFKGVTLLIVTCPKSREPVYLRFPNSKKSFFVRTGNTTNEPGPDELIGYMAYYFSDYLVNQMQGNLKM